MSFFRSQSDLFKAIYDNDVAAVADLLKHKPAWAQTAKNFDEENALFEAADYDREEITRLLINAGAKPLEAGNRWGDKPLMRAVAHDRNSALKAMLETEGCIAAFNAGLNAKPDFLGAALRRGNATTLELLLGTKGIDTKVVTSPEAFTLAIRHGANAKIVELLLKHGADPNGDEEHQPLESALTRTDNANIILMLLKAGANPSNTPFYYTSDETVIKALVDAGGDINKASPQGQTPLHAALKEKKEEDVLKKTKLLLKNGADPNITDKTGRTVLHTAVEANNLDLIKLLLEHGARRDIADENGKLPVDLAKRRKRVIRLLADPPTLKKFTEGADTGGWQRLGDNEIAQVRNHPDIGRKFIDIFNFAARERILIVENTTLHTETVMPPASFDAITEESLQTAFNAFRNQGGIADEAVVFKNRIVKPAAPRKL